MEDGFGRKIEYLRVSLTDRCNLRCRYCMGAEGIELKSHSDMMTLEEIFDFIKAFHALGGNKVRFTGGEPLVRRGATELIKKVKESIPSLSLSITTNGVLLPTYIDEMAKYLDGINISIDTLDSEKYCQITRGGRLEDALKAVDVAKASGIKKVKINAVLMKSFNDGEVNTFIDFGKIHHVDVRYIELMPFSSNTEERQYYISAEEVAAKNNMIFDGLNGHVSLYHNQNGKIGFITPISHSFCSSCNRIRLTSDGKILPCLHGNQEIGIKENKDKSLEEIIQMAVSLKPKCHRLAEGNLQSRDMNKIGG